MTHQEDFWNKIKKLKKYKEKYDKKLIKKEESAIILRAVDLCLENDEIIAGAYCMYMKNYLVRYASDIILDFFENQYYKYTPEHLKEN